MLQTVLDALRNLAQGTINPEELARRKVEVQKQKASAKTIRRKLEQKLEEARRTRLAAYKDKVSGTISEQEFADFSQQLRREEEQYQAQLERLQVAETQSEQEQLAEEKIRAFLQFDHLEKAQLQQLVRRVTVDSQKHIIIEFTFADPQKAD